MLLCISQWTTSVWDAEINGSVHCRVVVFVSLWKVNAGGGQIPLWITEAHGERWRSKLKRKSILFYFLITLNHKLESIDFTGLSPHPNSHTAHRVSHWFNVHVTSMGQPSIGLSQTLQHCDICCLICANDRFFLEIIMQKKMRVVVPTEVYRFSALLLFQTVKTCVNVGQ